MSNQRGFRFGWVLVSYLMIAGGFVLAVALFAALKVKSQWLGWLFFFVGGALGGFIAGRASEGKTILEPAIGGVLMIASVVGIIALVPGVRVIWALADQDTVMLYAAGIAGCTGAGGLVGATLGEMSSPPQRSDAGIRWVGISSLITTGLFFMTFMLLAILMLRSASRGEKLADDDAGVAVFVAMVVSAFFGGFVTQAIAPRRMNWACGTGFLVLMLALALVVTSMPKGGEAAGVFIIFGGVGTVIGALGGLVGWHAVAKKALEQGGLPVARTFE